MMLKTKSYRTIYYGGDYENIRIKLAQRYIKKCPCAWGKPAHEMWSYYGA